ncbi:MAG: secondary thiamine-phosphate synthase enzyme YjbQ [bacterium]
MQTGFRTKGKVEFRNITERIKKIIRKKGFMQGAVTVYVEHTTCAIAIMEDEKGLKKDVKNWLDSKVHSGISKDGPTFYHHQHPDGTTNSSAHIKAMIIGNSVIVPLDNHELKLGRYQQIFLMEFDGPRIRKVDIRITSR